MRQKATTMYAETNFTTKKALKEAVAAYLAGAGRPVRVFQPGPFGDGTETGDGRVCIEGPHYPQAHTWYASATLKDGIVVAVK
jgi:hypothetical protein